jgi:diguanylate cyclase (GGDEF)-like protein/PAS domain S-box-containing protein
MLIFTKLYSILSKNYNSQDSIERKTLSFMFIFYIVGILLSLFSAINHIFNNETPLLIGYGEFIVCLFFVFTFLLIYSGNYENSIILAFFSLCLALLNNILFNDFISENSIPINNLLVDVINLMLLSIITGFLSKKNFQYILCSVVSMIILTIHTYVIFIRTPSLLTYSNVISVIAYYSALICAISITNLYLDSNSKHIESLEKKSLELENFNRTLNELVLKRTKVIQNTNLKLSNEIIKHKKLEEALVFSERKFRSLVENFPDIVIRFDKNSRITYINPITESFFGSVNDNFEEKFNKAFNLSDLQNLYVKLTQVIETRNKVNFYINVTLNLELKYFEVIMVPEFNSKNRLMSVLVIAKDNTQIHKANLEIEYMIYHDSLTDLYNRNYYESYLSLLKDSPIVPLCIIVADVNNLKYTNDFFGHSQGDNLIITNASILKKMCGENSLVFRIGGDEFVAILNNTDEIAADKLIANINSQTSDLALGVAFRNSFHDNIDQIIKLADKRMYEDKFIKKNTKMISQN